MSKLFGFMCLIFHTRCFEKWVLDADHSNPVTTGLVHFVLVQIAANTIELIKPIPHFWKIKGYDWPGYLNQYLPKIQEDLLLASSNWESSDHNLGGSGSTLITKMYYNTLHETQTFPLDMHHGECTQPQPSLHNSFLCSRLIYWASQSTQRGKTALYSVVYEYYTFCIMQWTYERSRQLESTAFYRAKSSIMINSYRDGGRLNKKITGCRWT